MSVLGKLGIVGIRSFCTQYIQTIQFHPLTLICGQNGVGKTTIIQCLKFVTTGIPPPGTMGGKNFVLDPKLINKPEVVGEVKLNFSDFAGKKFVAGRKVMVSYVKKKGQQKMQFKTIEQSLKTRDEKTGEPVTINQHCAEIDRQIPSLFGVSKSVLQNVIFCQQDQALWPFGDNTTLKGIFDQLFQTKQYAKIYQIMRQTQKKMMKQLKQINMSLELRKQGFNKSIKNKKYNLSTYQQLIKKSYQIPKLVKKLQQLQLPEELNNTTQDSLRQKIKNLAILEVKKNGLISLLEELGSSQTQILNSQQEYKQRDILKLKDELNKIQIFLNEVVKTTSQLQKQYEDAKNDQLQKDVGTLISIQIKNAIEKFQFLKGTNHSIIIPRLAQQLQQLEKLSTKLTQFRRQLLSIKIPQLLPVQQKGYLQSLRVKQQIKNRELNELEEIYTLIYLLIYKQNVKQLPRVQYSENKHLQNQYQLNIQNQNLQKLKADRQNFQKYLSILKTKQTISQMQYTGIKVPQQMLKFAISKNKCTFCNKQFQNDELTHIQVRCEQRKQRVENTIKQLEKSIQQFSSRRINYDSIEQIDAQQRKIKRQIQRLTQQDKSFEQTKMADMKFKQNQKQLDINRKIDALLKRYDIIPRKNSSRLGLLNKQYSFQEFSQYFNEFVYGLQQIRTLRSEIKKIQELNDENNQRQIQRNKAISRKHEIQIFIDQIQPRIQLLPLVRSSLSKLRQLSTKTKKPKSKSNVSYKTIQQQLSQKVKQKTKLFSKKQSLQREVKLNTTALQYFTLVQQLENIMQTIKRLQRKIQTDRVKIEKAQSIKMEISTLKTLIQTQMSCIKQEQNRQNEYQKLLVADKVKRQAEKQLTNTMKSLELSLTQFHAQKLQQINRILKDIWQTIYRKGSFNSKQHLDRDIEYIKIRSTDEQNNPTQNKKKPYCYALMMCVQGSEIQMKGRCSMGQKVLASISIRLALAQCFATRCNILALDQPTANLDTAHIQSLAQSLGKLIQSRKEEKGFQLIIITHDMDFMNMLTQYAPYFYQIKKVKGWSKIYQQTI